MTDEAYMQMAIDLAKKGRGKTSPNPMVGCVIVKSNKIIGRGYHKSYGDKHAEISALDSVTDTIDGSTLYVTLEPCSHTGKTPPCVDAIIKSGVKRVVCAMVDPNKLVKGSGIKKLQKAVIKVELGLLEEKARELNFGFVSVHENARPYIAIKFASSLDGKIATRTKESKWITNEQARSYARSLRSKYNCIVIGSNTVIEDNPHLGARIKGKQDPIRIVLDNSLRTNPDHAVYRDTNVIVFASQKADKNKVAQFKSQNIEIYQSKLTSVSVNEILAELMKRNIQSILVEGGASVLGMFNDAKFIDKVYSFYAPIIIGGLESKSSIGGQGAGPLKDSLKFNQTSIKKFGSNFLVISQNI
ncbi:MAG: bifunctional diaminohydroxyphosphoribosylaminopyrimidine deaminase/5-amino-6-(5-phosphoribosylamino)uracil reductase RibD [Candidatus Saccharimonadales bacterium]